MLVSSSRGLRSNLTMFLTMERCNEKCDNVLCPFTTDIQYVMVPCASIPVYEAQVMAMFFVKCLTFTFSDLITYSRPSACLVVGHFLGLHSEVTISFTL